MPERVQARQLLKAAVRYYDDPQTDLAGAAKIAAGGGFGPAGNWMRIALAKIRNEPIPLRPVPFVAFGWIKYGLASGAAMACGFIAWRLVDVGALPVAVLAFYAMEAQMVFLFPLAVDGQPVGIIANRGWTQRAGGTLRIVAIVIPIAATMLFNGFRGKGFLRSWCLGCLAILLWYEKLRVFELAVTKPARWSVGAQGPLHIRTERLSSKSQIQPVRLMYASDLHFKGKSSGAVAAQLVAATQRCQPDFILLGGDLVDTKRGLQLLTETVRRLIVSAPVYAVAGNHDLDVGLANVQSAIEAGGGYWLEQRSIAIQPHSNMLLQLDGNVISQGQGGSIRILCAHDPKLFPQAAQSGYTLVLAGHLHGGQFVWAERAGQLYPAAWFYRWNGLRFQEGQTAMFVSRGVSDTVPIRWNCPREILLCELS